ncbi:MAG: selenoneine biosynthesis selenosugar synthase SenB [Pirellulaceae bacterium]
MRIRIVTPAPPRSRTGNRITASRWLRILRELGHQATIHQRFNGQPCDLLVALHAHRSAADIERFRRSHPKSPLLLALTGTDLYRDIARHEVARHSLELADRLILLQPHGQRFLSQRFQNKTRIIYQSVPAPKRIPQRSKTTFRVAVIGHLRSVKDPFRAAMATRRLPATSKIQISHFGAALDSRMEQRARREMQANARYHWFGEQPRWKTLRRLAASHLLVLSSKMEGGANVVSEAIVASVPVLSTRVSGSIGLLGDEYGGYFDVGDTIGLKQLLTRAETDADYYRTLSSWCEKRKPLFAPEREKATWKKLLQEFSST